MGTPNFAVPILQQLLKDDYHVCLVVTQPDRPKGRKRVLTAPPVKQEALKHNLPIYQPEKIKDNYEEILSYQPDLIVTAAFGQILPKALLDAPKYGCINVHASLLPELRGGAPIHYAILQGKKETGITMMYMVEALDAGAILSQVSVTIEKDDHVGTLHDKLAKAGATLLHESLPGIIDGTIKPVEQDDELATYAPNITREQEKINWEMSHIEVYNHIRGLHPWPVASTTLREKNVKIWWAEPVDDLYKGESGEVLMVEPESILVCCGDNRAVRITEIQPAGKKRMSVTDYLRGSGKDLEIGEKLGV